MAYIPPKDVHSPRSHWLLVTVLVDKGPETNAKALGKWDNNFCLASRWNGNDDAPVGHPNSRGFPMWYIHPKEDEAALVSTLPADKQEICKALLGL